MSVSLASLCGERWSGSVRREDAKTEESLCADFSSQSNKEVQRRVGIQALFLCLQIYSKACMLWIVYIL